LEILGCDKGGLRRRGRRLALPRRVSGEGGGGQIGGGEGWIRVGVVYIQTSERILIVQLRDRRFPANKVRG
jgi:hypothetical protein